MSGSASVTSYSQIHSHTTHSAIKPVWKLSGKDLIHTVPKYVAYACVPKHIKSIIWYVFLKPWLKSTWSLSFSLDTLKFWLSTLTQCGWTWHGTMRWSTRSPNTSTSYKGTSSSWRPFSVEMWSFSHRHGVVRATWRLKCSTSRPWWSPTDILWCAECVIGRIPVKKGDSSFWSRIYQIILLLYYFILDYYFLVHHKLILAFVHKLWWGFWCSEDESQCFCDCLTFSLAPAYLQNICSLYHFHGLFSFTFTPD